VEGRIGELSGAKANRQGHTRRKRAFRNRHRPVHVQTVVDRGTLLTEVAEVQEAGQPSWRIEFDEPQPLVIGLFVRDVAGLRSRSAWLPHCVPATTRANGEGSEEAARQWDLWWERSLSNNWNGPDQSQEQLAAMWWLPPDFESLHSTPALQEVVARHFSDARQWARDRKKEYVELMIGTPDPRPFHRGRPGRGLDETKLVADLERNLGRRARPFQLQITEIPVAGKELWQLDPHHVLLTAELLRDSDEYRGRITPVLQTLL
jgi:hypothetical protein